MVKPTYSKEPGKVDVCKITYEANAEMSSLIEPQKVQRVIVHNDKLLILTDNLMFSCSKIVDVLPTGEQARDAQPTEQLARCVTVTGNAAYAPTMVVCEPSLVPPEAGMSTVVQQVATKAPPVRNYRGRYWGVLPWKIDQAVYFHKACEVLTTQLPCFRAEVLLQQTMSAAGVSLPMHGTGAVGHSNFGLYTKWLCCDGSFLTQPWVRQCVTTVLQKHHLSSPHKQMPVGIICLARPDLLLSDMSLSQARWLAAHTKAVQASVDKVFAAAAEHGYVHLTAGQPASIAITLHNDGTTRAYLIDWSCCAERVRIRASNQREVMTYLMGIPEGVVMSACQAFPWHKHN
jgi:hypothetical protein